MLQVGNKVKYRDLVGEVTSVMDDMIIVRLPDGKDYSLPYNAVTLDESVSSVNDLQNVLTSLKPYLKNVSFLNDLAKTMSQSGISELHIKSGMLQTFKAKESLEERVSRYKAEALLAAEIKAKEDHEKDSSSIA